MARSIESMGLEGVWNLKPMLNGGEVKVVLPNIPRGPIFSEVMQVRGKGGGARLAYTGEEFGSRVDADICTMSVPLACVCGYCARLACGMLLFGGCVLGLSLWRDHEPLRPLEGVFFYIYTNSAFFSCFCVWSSRC